MKLLFWIFLALVISGCSLTEAPDAESPELTTSQITDENKVTDLSSLEPCRINHETSGNQQKMAAGGHEQEACIESQEGVAKLIHPTQEVDVPLPLPETIPAEVEANLWKYIAKNVSLEVPTGEPRLEAQKRWYLRHPDYMKRVSKRATPFLYYIVKELEANDIPLDIALLPIVESAFDPFAYSSGRAAGMWQFIPGTGKRFGMPQNWWYDGRRDVVASTQGAIAYLKYLHNMFDGNWMHALAAYNSGEGRVQRAIRKNKRAGKATDFWSLDLPKETRAYVPKLLALSDMLKNAENYNFKWPVIDNVEVIQVVNVGSQIDLAKAAQMANLTLPELQALNPGFNQWATNPQGPHRLVLPLDRAESFGLALNNTPENERLNWERHKIRSGESIGKIAKQYNTNVDVIRRINNIKGNTIYAGDHLLVPVALSELDAYALNAAQNLYHTSSNRSQQAKFTHTVQSGDTLWDIAGLHKVSVNDLARWNRMSTRDTLKLGKKLTVYQKGSSTDSRRSVTYSVRRGDSLSLIASKFQVKVNDILRWNSLSKNKYLQPGQQLTLLVDITKS
ncbi:LysM peptidoglycan-binding domain-containing protein [Ningiella sp. W23]|uniref:lytic transglycosylase n=1 Tax=Ningiella sp. W23 TaxID=3023715 RepID=UPI003756BF44